MLSFGGVLIGAAGRRHEKKHQYNHHEMHKVSVRQNIEKTLLGRMQDAPRGQSRLAQASIDPHHNRERSHGGLFEPAAEKCEEKTDPAAEIEKPLSGHQQKTHQKMIESVFQIAKFRKGNMFQNTEK